MGMSTRPIPFFTDTIRIRVTECTYANDCGKTRSLCAFARGQRLNLEQIEETGEYVATRQDGAFIRGPEA